MSRMDTRLNPAMRFSSGFAVGDPVTGRRGHPPHSRSTPQVSALFRHRAIFVPSIDFGRAERWLDDPRRDCESPLV